ncbi:cysteine hydrolase [Streptomyces cinnamoneus]|uniref:Cysteine hydrolase n=1 Tax=Streptomyces cinnamoneus TaxID=53446 RepID=A0A2G1XEY9_STRCJ|nr:cysteine hydrolase family protein [Streptomyces cinnamoneus]PHQ49775.1 cysteine hydrolase [Streptomyces cinnamoneus]PPT13882.1 cysteine hydrolase [Streptomyces cinnamoneus]
MNTAENSSQNTAENSAENAEAGAESTAPSAPRTLVGDIAPDAALLVIDVQKAWHDPSFPPRDNPAAEDNMAQLIDAWQETGRPVVFVRHDSPKADSPLRPGQEGNDFQPFVEQRRGKGTGPELLLTKTVNSAFIGTPDLRDWLDGAGIRQIVVVGVMTNWCVETTARMGGNLGYDVVVPIDATHTFDAVGPDGHSLTADELARATATNLHAGGFAKVVRTADLLG